MILFIDKVFALIFEALIYYVILRGKKKIMPTVVRTNQLFLISFINPNMPILALMVRKCNSLFKQLLIVLRAPCKACCKTPLWDLINRCYVSCGCMQKLFVLDKHPENRYINRKRWYEMERLKLAKDI